MTIAKFYFEFFSGNEQNAQYSFSASTYLFYLPVYPEADLGLLQHPNGALCDNCSRLKAVKYYHKALHLGCCSSPRSACDINISIVTNLIVTCGKVEDKPEEMFDRALLESEDSIAECESYLTTSFCLFLTV